MSKSVCGYEPYRASGRWQREGTWKRGARTEDERTEDERTEDERTDENERAVTAVVVYQTDSFTEDAAYWANVPMTDEARDLLVRLDAGDATDRRLAQKVRNALVAEEDAALRQEMRAADGVRLPPWVKNGNACEHYVTRVVDTRTALIECVDCLATWHYGEYMPPVPRDNAGW